MKILALDFDGVIADSQMECLFVGFNAYLKMHKGTKLFGGKKFTFDNFNGLMKKHSKIADKYKKLRPYVIDAFCYYAISYIIEKNIKIINQSQYNKVRKKLMGKYGKYVKYFYNERYSLQGKNYKKWLELEISFKKIINGIKRLENQYKITIATNNNRKSISGFLEKYKINPAVIADSNISIDKEKQLWHIKNELRANFNEIYFVDDNVANFFPLLKLKVNCYLATWGYNTKKQHEEAKRLGAVLLSQNNFYNTLSKQ